MPGRFFDRGLHCIAERASLFLNNGASTPAATALQQYIRSMSADSSGTAFTAATTALGGPASLVVKEFESTPTRAGLVVSHIALYGTGDANFTVQRFCLHNEAAASVTGTSTTAIAGIDGQSIQKTNSFNLRVQLDATYSTVVT